MTRQQVLDLYFLEARSKLVDLGGFLDRLERATGEEDFRMNAFRKALEALGKTEEAYDYYVCPICGYTHAKNAPDKCPVCGTLGSKFQKIS